MSRTKFSYADVVKALGYTQTIDKKYKLKTIEEQDILDYLSENTVLYYVINHSTSTVLLVGDRYYRCTTIDEFNKVISDDSPIVNVDTNELSKDERFKPRRYYYYNYRYNNNQNLNKLAKYIYDIYYQEVLAGSNYGEGPYLFNWQLDNIITPSGNNIYSEFLKTSDNIQPRVIQSTGRYSTTTKDTYLDEDNLDDYSFDGKTYGIIFDCKNIVFRKKYDNIMINCVTKDTGDGNNNTYDLPLNGYFMGRNNILDHIQYASGHLVNERKIAKDYISKLPKLLPKIEKHNKKVYSRYQKLVDELAKDADKEIMALTIGYQNKTTLWISNFTYNNLSSISNIDPNDFTPWDIQKILSSFNEDKTLVIERYGQKLYINLEIMAKKVSTYTYDVVKSEYGEMYSVQFKSGRYTYSIPIQNMNTIKVLSIVIGETEANTLLAKYILMGGRE